MIYTPTPSAPPYKLDGLEAAYPFNWVFGFSPRKSFFELKMTINVSP